MRTWCQSALALLAVLTMLLAASPAAEVPPARIAVVALAGKGSGALYDAARAEIERNTTLRVTPFDVFSPSLREAVVRQCAGDSQCFAAKVRSSGAAVDLVLAISVNALAGSQLLGMRLVDLSTGDAKELGVVGDTVSEGAPTEPRMRALLPKLFPPEIWGQVAELTVTVTPSDAEVVVRNVTCDIPCRLSRVSPGSYPVRARKAGYATFEKTVLLAPGAKENVSVRLEEKSNTLWWVLGAVGVAVIGGGVAAGVALSGGDDGRAVVCLGTGAEGCP